MVYNCSMPHFFINSVLIKNNEVKISDKNLINHLVNARRIKCGQKLLLIDENKIQYETKVLSVERNLLITQILQQYPSFRELDVNITVARCVLKQDADFSAIQKATELGVKTIIPIISDNCAVNEKIIMSKADKFQKIADESVKQCERADFPTVQQPLKIDDFLNSQLGNYDKILVISERAKNYGIKNFFKNHPYKKNDRILAIIGCEGGFSQREFNLFEKYHLEEITLGKLIMRADTALTAAVFGIIQEVSDD